MNTQKKTKDRLKGKRLFVHQAGRGKYTTISVPQTQYDELLELAHLDDHTLRSCARWVSWHGRAVEGQAWSATVVAAMLQKLRRDHNPALLAAARAALAEEEQLAAQAAENNAAWTEGELQAA